MYLGISHSSQKQPPQLFCKKVFLKISQNSQENREKRDCGTGVFRVCFPVNIVKFLRKPFLQNNSGQWLLDSVTGLFHYKCLTGS